MDPNRRRRGRAGRPWWESQRLATVALAVTLGLVAVTLGVFVGIVAIHAVGRRPTASPATAHPSTLSNQVPKASRAPITPPPRSPATTSTRFGNPSSTTIAHRAPAKPDAPILQRRRPVPAGVFEQMLSTFGGADGSACDIDHAGLDVMRLHEPTIAIGTDQRPNYAVAEIAAPIQLCLWRFAPGRSIHVTVRYPDGRSETSIGYPPCQSDDCYSHVNWAAVPGDPHGAYRVTAVQGRLRATGTVRAVPATRRHLLVVGNGVDEGQYGHFKRGQTIQVVAGGYQPRRGVQLLVYHTSERVLQQSGEPLRFRTWIQLPTDSQGGVVYRLRTAAGDPPGCYALDTRPAPQHVLRAEETDPLTHDLVLNVKATEPLFCLT